jgi:NADH-quinone oxidoreductase subunit C
MDQAIRDTALKDLSDAIAAALPGSILGSTMAFGELTLAAKREDIVAVAQFLRDADNWRFISIVDICGADYPERIERFDVVYHFLSPTRNIRVRVKISTDEDTPVASLTPVFKGADWYEREAYDLYGILFTGHPDLRRLLTDYGFDGHPLRKDFPLTGFVEVRYDEERKRVVYEPVKLQQEFRSFDYLSPWEGTDYVLPGDEKKSS